MTQTTRAQQKKTTTNWRNSTSRRHRQQPLQIWLFLLTILPFLCSKRIHAAFVTPLEKTAAVIKVRPVKSSKDVMGLADLRYDEWMASDPDPSSRHGFRAATADIIQERNGAQAFLAHIGQEAVDAAELSPIELRGTCPTIEESRSYFYVTDVVTSKNHRRKGVGDAIMKAIEEYAVSHEGATRLFLHVKPNNSNALAFYQRAELGYCLHLPNSLNLDRERLAQNAGAEGQILLCKSLLEQQQRPAPKKQAFGAGGGFGGQLSSAKLRKKKKRR